MWGLIQRDWRPQEKGSRHRQEQSEDPGRRQPLYQAKRVTSGEIDPRRHHRPLPASRTLRKERSPVTAAQSVLLCDQPNKLRACGPSGSSLPPPHPSPCSQEETGHKSRAQHFIVVTEHRRHPMVDPFPQRKSWRGSPAPLAGGREGARAAEKYKHRLDLIPAL